MKIAVNEKQVEVPVQSNITSLFEKIGLPSASGIAVAVNNQIVKKENWEEFLLAENDQVLIIKATQGG